MSGEWRASPLATRLKYSEPARTPGPNRTYHCHISNWVSVHLGPAPANRRFLCGFESFTSWVWGSARMDLPRLLMSTCETSYPRFLSTANVSRRRSSNSSVTFPEPYPPPALFTSCELLFLSDSAASSLPLGDIFV